MATSEVTWKSNGRPESTLALNFSAALDEMFKLNGLGALEESVVQKKDQVQSQILQLDDIELRLKEADERLKELEAKRRIQKHQKGQTVPPGRRQKVPSYIQKHARGNSSGDSDEQGRTSPESDGSRA